jgi:hypothetical protein
MLGGCQKSASISTPQQTDCKAAPMYLLTQYASKKTLSYIKRTHLQQTCTTGPCTILLAGCIIRLV